MTRFPPLVSRLIPSLGRENDNEVIAAAKAIGAALKTDGRDWHDLAQAIETVGRPAGIRTTLSTSPSSSARSSGSWAPGHRAGQAHNAQDRARWLAMYGAAGLSDRERDFVDNLLRQLARRGARASERQEAWLGQIFARVSRAAA